MIGTTFIHKILKNAGFSVYQSFVYYMSYAVGKRMENGKLPVVIIVDNKERHVELLNHKEQFQNVVMVSGNVPDDKEKLDFLFVIIHNEKDRYLMGKDILLVDKYNGEVYSRKVSKSLRKTADLIMDAVEYVKAQENRYKYKYGFPCKTYTPWMTYLLVIVSVCTYILTYFNKYHYGYSAERIFQGSIFGIFTYMFIHSSIYHLISNMICLYRIGSALEEKIGAVKLTVIYVISGLYGAIFDILINLHSKTITIGASGAVCGLLTALIVQTLFTPKKQRCLNVRSLMINVILILISGFLSPTVNQFCHIGGMIGGIICMLMICAADKFDLHKEALSTIEIIREKEKKFYSDAF